MKPVLYDEPMQDAPMERLQQLDNDTLHEQGCYNDNQ